MGHKDKTKVKRKIEKATVTVGFDVCDFLFFIFDFYLCVCVCG